jgi:molybdopterin converting factor small subunit
MTVWIRLGASVLAGTADPARFELNLHGEPTVQTVINELVRRHPSIGPRVLSAVFVVAGQAVDTRFVLHEGDEVAVLVPVAGGTELRTIGHDGPRKSQIRRACSNGS